MHALFATQQVFTRAEWEAYRAPGSAAAAGKLLEYHLSVGHVTSLRRGLYAAVPPGADADKLKVDPRLVACRLAPDAAVGAEAALAIWIGEGEERPRKVSFVTQQRLGRLKFRGTEFLPLKTDHARGSREAGIVEHRRDVGTMWVTSPERTLVDLLDLGGHAGTLRAAWPRLGALAGLDVDVVIAFAIRSGRALTAGRVGHFLELYRAKFGVTAAQLSRLEAAGPRQRRYFDHTRTGRHAGRWNLITPAWANVRTGSRSAPEGPEGLKPTAADLEILEWIGEEPIHIDALVEKTGVAIPQLLATLMRLELTGLCVNRSMHFTRP